MREIKFRGKRIDNGEWVCGYYVYYGWAGKQKHYIVPEYASDLYAVEVDQKTVGQYTGLKDMNGKEIYEGDTIQDCDTEKIKTVVWHENCFILQDAKGFYRLCVGTAKAIICNRCKKVIDEDDIEAVEILPPHQRKLYPYGKEEFRPSQVNEVDENQGKQL